MKQSFPHFIDGKLDSIITLPVNRRKLTLKEQITNAKRARRDARLVQILTR